MLKPGPQIAADDPDRGLVGRAVDGELDAFAALIERHRAAVFRVAARIAGPDAAEDISQDTFLRAFNTLGRFRAEASFRSWLLRIAHNAALNAIQRGREVPLGDARAVESRAVATATRTPADALEVDERRRRLLAKVLQVTPRFRAAVVLRDFEDLSYEEISVILDAPLGTVKTHVHRGRRELVELLRNNTYDWELPT